MTILFRLLMLVLFQTCMKEVQLNVDADESKLGLGLPKSEKVFKKYDKSSP